MCSTHPDDPTSAHIRDKSIENEKNPTFSFTMLSHQHYLLPEDINQEFKLDGEVWNKIFFCSLI